MRRLARILLNMVSMLSLLLCVAAMTLWVRGRWLEEQVFFAHPGGRMWLLRSVSDGLRCEVAEGWAGRRDWDYGRVAKGGSYEQRRHLRPYCFGAINNGYTVTDWPLGIATIRDKVFVELGDDGAALSLAGPLWGRRSPDMPVRGIFVPDWILVVATALLPLGRLGWWFRRAVIRRRRLRRGECPACGYDCRATPDRCPECGRTVISTAGSAREGKGETEGV